MTSSFIHAGETIRAIERAGLRELAKNICGGPAVDSEMARRIGAGDVGRTTPEGGVTKMEALVEAKTEPA